MKILYQRGPNGLDLSYVECNSTEEADQFTNWFMARALNNRDGAQEELPLEEEAAPNEPQPIPEKITRAELSKAAIALVQTKGRGAIAPILEKYNAKRISEIPEDKLTVAYADVAEAM